MHASRDNLDKGCKTCKKDFYTFKWRIYWSPQPFLNAPVRCNEVLKGQLIQDTQDTASGRCKVTAPEWLYREGGVAHPKLLGKVDSLLQIFMSEKFQKFQNILTKNPPDVQLLLGFIKGT